MPLDRNWLVQIHTRKTGYLKLRNSMLQQEGCKFFIGFEILMKISSFTLMYCFYTFRIDSLLRTLFQISSAHIFTSISTHLSSGFILLVFPFVLLVPETGNPEFTVPLLFRLEEFISADFWNTSIVALAMFSNKEFIS